MPRDLTKGKSTDLSMPVGQRSFRINDFLVRVFLGLLIINERLDLVFLINDGLAAKII